MPRLRMVNFPRNANFDSIQIVSNLFGAIGKPSNSVIRLSTDGGTLRYVDEMT